MDAKRRRIAHRTAIAAREDQHEHDSRCDDAEGQESPEDQREDRSVGHGATPPAREVLRSEMLAEELNSARPGPLGRVHVRAVLPILLPEESVTGAVVDRVLVYFA